MNRRDFLLSTTAASLALSAAGGKRTAGASIAQEPKSIHTWLDSPEPGIYAYDVDVRVNEFPKNPVRGWLYYFALQVGEAVPRGRDTAGSGARIRPLSGKRGDGTGTAAGALRKRTTAFGAGYSLSLTGKRVRKRSTGR